jgi:hypothetical protein
MIKSVASLSLSESIADIVQQVKGVHIIENWRLALVKDFLIERVEVLSVIDYYFAICCCYQPFIVRF